MRKLTTPLFCMASLLFLAIFAASGYLSLMPNHERQAYVDQPPTNYTVTEEAYHNMKVIDVAESAITLKGSDGHNYTVSSIENLDDHREILVRLKRKKLSVDIDILKIDDEQNVHSRGIEEIRPADKYVTPINKRNHLPIPI